MTLLPLSPEDEALWQLACAGDELARTTLIDRTWSALQFRVRRFAAAERDELRQRIALAVLRAVASGVVPDRNMNAMLEWRGRAEITGYVRELSKSRRLTDVGEILEIAGCDPTPFAGLQVDEIRATLARCIEKVPSKRHRAAVRARLVDGEQPRVIAARTGVAVDLVRVWIARAAAMVRSCVERALAGGNSP